jgi:ketosteroid isomerase-like protein
MNDELQTRTRQQLELLDRFCQAWNAHDVEALLTMVTPDCVYDGSTGPALHGVRFQGHEELRRGFAGVWEASPDARWEEARHVACGGDRAFTEWVFRGKRLSDGSKVDSQGVDLFQFRDGLIAYKNTFRKMVTA